MERRFPFIVHGINTCPGFTKKGHDLRMPFAGRSVQWRCPINRCVINICVVKDEQPRAPQRSIVAGEEERSAPLLCALVNASATSKKSAGTLVRSVLAREMKRSALETITDIGVGVLQGGAEWLRAFSGA
jgi:hypothetical protein